MADYYVTPETAEGSGMDLGMDLGIDMGMDFYGGGTGDGSQEQPWNGFSNVQQGTGANEFGPGDTLWVRGTHYERLAITVSGTSGSPAVVRGDYPGDPGTIKIFRDVVGLTWTDQGGNVWSADITDTESVNRVLLDDVGYEVAASAVAVDSANRWFQSTNTLYVYATSDPDGFYSSVKILQATSAYYDCISAVNQSYITVQNITLWGGGQVSLRFIHTDAAGINLPGNIVDGVTVRMSGRHGILMEGKGTTYYFDGPIVRNCDCDKQHFTTEGTDVQPTGNGCYFSGSVQDGYINDNTFVDYGHSAIELIGKTSQTCSGNAVYGNRAYVVNSPYMRGFDTGPTGGTASVDGNLIYNNDFRGCNIQDQINGQNNKYYCNLLNVIDTPASADGTAGVDLFTTATYGCVGNVVAFNVFFECDQEAIHLAANTTNMGANTIVNNIVYEAGQDGTSPQIRMSASTGGASRATQTITNNCIYAAAGGDLIEVDGTGYTVAGADSSIADFSDNAATAVDPALDAQLRPTNAALVGAGVAVAGVTTDYDGNTYSDPPTIGAFEMEGRLGNWRRGAMAALIKSRRRRSCRKAA